MLIIYYKQISEGYEDAKRFDIMQKVGMTKKEIRSSISSQLLTVFALPMIFAGMHLIFAFPMIRKMLAAWLCAALVWGCAMAEDTSKVASEADMTDVIDIVEEGMEPVSGDMLKDGEYEAEVDGAPCLQSVPSGYA